jgi:hypothetical protein
MLWVNVTFAKLCSDKHTLINVCNEIKTVDTSTFLVFILLHVSVHAGYSEAKEWYLKTQKFFHTFLKENSDLSSLSKLEISPRAN